MERGTEADDEDDGEGANEEAGAEEYSRGKRQVRTAAAAVRSTLCSTGRPGVRAGDREPGYQEGVEEEQKEDDEKKKKTKGLVWEREVVVRRLSADGLVRSTPRGVRIVSGQDGMW
jgi:hypothetical protein